MWRIAVDIVVLLFITLFGYIKPRDVLPQKEFYLPDYSMYHNYSDIQLHIRKLVNKNPYFMKADWTFHSREHLPQILLRVSNFSMAVPKRKVLFSYGEHAREFFPVESMFGFLNALLKGVTELNCSEEELCSRTILSHFDLFIIVMANPDGRKYLEKSHNYCWRGTSTGVDLNRNFDWQFGRVGSSGNTKDEEYRGPSAFSEPECEIFRDITSQHRFEAFFSFHSGIRQIYIPYTDTESKSLNRQPDNFDGMLRFAKQISRSTKYDFTYGEGFTLNEYTADGTIFDYMAGVRKIGYSFAIELWGEGDHKGARCFDLFNPRSEDLKKAVTDILPLYYSIFQYLHQNRPPVFMQNIYGVSSIRQELLLGLRLGYILLVAVVLLTCYFAIYDYLPFCLRCIPRRRIISLRNLSSTFSTFTFKTT